MSIVSLKELKAALPKSKRLIGIDHSKKAWGLALSNPELSIATPLKTIMCEKFSKDVLALAALCKEYDVGGFVIGLPLNDDGSESPRTESVRHFGDNLIRAKDQLGFEPLIAFYDESFSTASAGDLLSQHSRLSRQE